MQVMYDPSPSPPADRFSGEFRSFVDVCLLKEAEARPTAEQVRLLLVLLLYTGLINHEVVSSDLRWYLMFSILGT